MNQNQELTVPGQKLVTIDQELISKLDSWEDHISAFMQIDEISSAYSWLKADILFHLVYKFGVKSLEKFSQEVRQPRSTVINYVRTSRAFPADKRIPELSFSHHFQASYADDYDDKTNQFKSDHRFEWLEKAIDEDLSTRRLAERIQGEKKKLAPPEIIACTFCKLTEGEVKTYALYSLENHKSLEKFELHDECYNQVVSLINQGK